MSLYLIKSLTIIVMSLYLLTFAFYTGKNTIAIYKRNCKYQHYAGPTRSNREIKLYI